MTEDFAFRRAVALIDAGHEAGLRALLADQPHVARRRVVQSGAEYFRYPALLWFVAENPIRSGSLPQNIVAIAKTILAAGAGKDGALMNGALGLVASGRIARECVVQIPLIGALCGSGADPNAAMFAALAHGEFSAVEELIEQGAAVTLPVAAGLGRLQDCRTLLPDSDAADCHRALALAAQFGHAEIVGMLLEAGEDPNRSNPGGFHAHSTPLHQAALGGHREVVQLLVEHGARRDAIDTVHRGTPADWAQYAGHAKIAEYLR